MPATDPVLPLIVELGLGLLFLSACVHKLRDFSVFKATLEDYQLVPTALSSLISVCIIAAEGLAALGLLSRLYVMPAITCGVVLLSLYSAAMGINLLRGRRDIDCGCTGPAMRQSISQWMVARNVVLAGTAIFVLAPQVPRDLGLVDLMTVVLGVTTAALIYNSANFLIANGPKLQQLRG